jgi:hypothetical protein
MIYIHNFVKQSLLHQRKEIASVQILYGLQKKTTLHAVSLFELKKIFIDGGLSKEEAHMGFLHEIFHYYFRDVCDKRTSYVDATDPVEIRAEISAKNMLQWYKKNKDHYNEFKLLFSKLRKRKITKNDIEEIL